MNSKLLGFIFFLLLSLNGWSELSMPYDYITVLPFDDHGWFFNESQLRECFSDRSIKSVIEVGSWLGLSARFFAEQVGEGGKVYCIDNWMGAPFPTHLEKEAYFEQRDRLAVAYQQFLSNIIHANLTDRIIPLRMDSLEAAVSTNIIADLIYIDASHSEEAVFDDILAWSKHLAPGGILCGDDWAWPEVRRGVERAAIILKKTIHSQGNFWKFMEPTMPLIDSKKNRMKAIRRSRRTRYAYKKKSH